MDGNYEFLSGKAAFRIFLEKFFATFALGSFLVFFLMRAGGIAGEAPVNLHNPDAWKNAVAASGDRHSLEIVRVSYRANGATGGLIREE